MVSGYMVLTKGSGFLRSGCHFMDTFVAMVTGHVVLTGGSRFMDSL